jgi:hypothetical protein
MKRFLETMVVVAMVLALLTFVVMCVVGLVHDLRKTAPEFIPPMLMPTGSVDPASGAPTFILVLPKQPEVYERL